MTVNPIDSIVVKIPVYRVTLSCTGDTGPRVLIDVEIRSQRSRQNNAVRGHIFFVITGDRS